MKIKNNRKRKFSPSWNFAGLRSGSQKKFPGLKQQGKQMATMLLKGNAKRALATYTIRCKHK